MVLCNMLPRYLIRVNQDGIGHISATINEEKDNSSSCTFSKVQNEFSIIAATVAVHFPMFHVYVS